MNCDCINASERVHLSVPAELSILLVEFHHRCKALVCSRDVKRVLASPNRVHGEHVLRYQSFLSCSLGIIILAYFVRDKTVMVLDFREISALVRDGLSQAQ